MDNTSKNKVLDILVHFYIVSILYRLDKTLWTYSNARFLLRTFKNKKKTADIGICILYVQKVLSDFHSLL